MNEPTNVKTLVLTPEEASALVDGLDVLMMDDDNGRYEFFESIYNKLDQ
jgi:hypothetical protein